MDKRATIEKNASTNQHEEIIASDELEAQLPEEEYAEEMNSSAPDFERESHLLKDQLLRAMAETENVRRRAEKQVDDAAKYAVTSFARDLINVLENLYRAGEAITPEAIEENPLLKNIHDGVEMTKRELLGVFDRHGITRIDPVIGEAFDPHLHQAVAQFPSQDVPPGAIAHVMQAGYAIKDRLLRPAMVAVAKEQD
jgi:molecular chaperone GrpE